MSTKTLTVTLTIEEWKLMFDLLNMYGLVNKQDFSDLLVSDELKLINSSELANTYRFCYMTMPS